VDLGQVQDPGGQAAVPAAPVGLALGQVADLVALLVRAVLVPEAQAVAPEVGQEADRPAVLARRQPIQI
jgi:hypothetical protein